MKAGLHAPLGARSGVADYAAALLPALRRRGAVEPGAAAAGVHLYHLGNNPLHAAIYRRALAHPGVVVLHDAVLHHFLLGTLTEAAYVEEFVYNYGEWYRSLAAEMWRRRARSASAAAYFERPMLRRVAETARAVIVHNPAAAAMVRAHAPAARIVEIPHLLERPPAVDPFPRERLGIPPRACLFGVFGFLRESKRVLPVLRAFERARQAAPHARLLLAGECVSADLARALERGACGPGVIRLGYSPEARFWRHAAMVDACINLRFPAAGETSGVAIRLMGIGKLVFVTEGLETSRFPEDACWRIDAGLGEERMLADSLFLVARETGLAREMGRRAAAYVRREHGIERAAEMYWKVLCDCRD